MEKIPEEIMAHVTEVYGYDRELFERMIDAFDMAEFGLLTLRDENQNICAFSFIGHTNYIYYGHVLTAALVSCLGVTKFGDAKDLLEMLKELHKFKYTKADVTIYEVESERFERIYTRFSDGVLIGSNCRTLLTQEEALNYPPTVNLSLQRLSADEFYPLYEQWIREQDYQFAMIFSYDNIKKLEECVDMIAAYDKNGHIAGLTILYKEKHHFSDYLEPIFFDATDDCVRKAMIRYLAENYGCNGKDILIRAYGKADDPDFAVSGFIYAATPRKMLSIYAQAHPEEHRVIHLVSDRVPEVSGYYTISGGVATYTKEPIEGAEHLTRRELNHWLFPYSNCCFYF